MNSEAKNFIVKNGLDTLLVKMDLTPYIILYKKAWSHLSMEFKPKELDKNRLDI